MTELLEVDACVVGGGPAGAVLARRLAQLGHAVAVVERSAHAGPMHGETLHPGGWPLLEHLGITGEVLATGARPVRRTLLRWAGDEVIERDHDPPQLAVARPRLDATLLALARRAGVSVLQPALARDAVLEGDTWRIAVEHGARAIEVRARLVADASGRAAWRRGERDDGPTRAIAIRGLWSGEVPAEARVEALEDGWLWGAPAAPGRYAVMAIVDARARLGPERYAAALHASALFRELPARATLVGELRHDAATAHAAQAACDERLLRVGDASCCLDPLSSAGLHAALGSALHAAAAIHTWLRHPERAPLVRRFYEDAQRTQAARHRGWTAERYAESRHREQPFWAARAELPPPPPAPPPAPPTGELDPASTHVALADGVALGETPCIAGDLIEARLGVTTPFHDRPFVWAGGVAIAPLLAPLVARAMTPGELVATWRDVPAARHRELLAWLLRARIVHPVAG